MLGVTARDGQNGAMVIALSYARATCPDARAVVHLLYDAQHHKLLTNYTSALPNENKDNARDASHGHDDVLALLAGARVGPILVDTVFARWACPASPEPFVDAPLVEPVEARKHAQLVPISKVFHADCACFVLSR